jgi:Protein of unknown function (DUF3089)
MQSKKARFLFVLSLLFIVGCSPNYSRYIQSYTASNNNTIPDYSNLFYWAAHPLKSDPSDSIPEPLRPGYLADSSADVFFLYPTTLTDKADLRWNADINDSFINAKTDYSTILFQASVFNEYRIYAPRYRQAHLRSYYISDTAKAVAAFNLAYQDIKMAFQYYLAHYNKERPIIIASHSQGSTHAQRLLKEFFENNQLKNQLVVAYVIGMYIPNNYFKELTICKDSSQTGCLCGWRSFKKGYEPEFIKKEKGTGLITNPITWTTTDETAGNRRNKGSLLFNFNKIKYNVAGAQIHDGILWIDKLHVPGSFLVKRKNFHVGDINIFYLNIREDVKRRVRLFWKQ